MAQDLGTAVLRLEVQTQEALQALNAFRGQVASALKDTNTASIFSGVEQGAKAAGEKAGRALTEGVKKATKELKFSSFQQALDFSPKNSVKGLEDYARALRNLRDKTDLGVAGTQQLTDRLGAVEAALRQAKQTTAQTAAEQKRFNDALDKVALQRFADQAKGFAAGLREQAKAAAANAEQFRRLRDQAEGAAKAIAGIAAKGVGEALKVPIFGLPKDVTSTFDKAKAQIERLQRQAETASGKVARLSEGIAVLGAGGVAAKGVIDTLGGIGSAASNTTGILSQVQQALESLPGPLKGLGGLDDVFARGAQSVAEWSASILQAQGELSTLTAPLEAVTNSLSALGPEAAVVGGALAFTFAGFQDLIAKSFKPGIDGARAALKGMTADTQALLEALAAASQASKGIASLNDLRIAEKDAMTRVQSSPVGTEANLQASQELLDIQRRIKEELQAQFYQNQRLALSEQERAQIAKQLQNAAKPSGPLALPSSQMLNAEGRGIRRLAPDVGPAIDVGLQSARTFTAELLNAGKAGEQLPPIFGQVGRSLRSVVDLTVEQTQGTKFQNELLQDQLALQQQLRSVEAQRSREAKQRLASDAEKRRAKELAIGEFNSVPLDGRLPDGRFIPGSPGARRAQNRRSQEGIGNAVIGGAFPLLFGQGLGASVGGGLGGLAGGALGGNFGFGLSLIGTAIGSAVDALNQRFKDIAIALQTPIQSFDKLKEVSLFASKAQEGYIQALIEAGRTAEATQAIQREAGKTIDQGSALLLAGSSEEVARAFSDLQDRLSNFTASAGAGFNQWLTELIRIAGGRPGAEVPLTGQEAVQAARGQQNTGGALLGLGAGLLLGAGALVSAPVSVPLAITAGVATGGLALGGLGAAGIAGGGQREAVATSAAVKAAEEQVNAVLERQKATQEQINAAKSAGLTKTAELLQISGQFQAADQNAAQQRLQIEAQVAANQLSKQQAEERLKQIEDARVLTSETLVATQQAAAAAAGKELSNAQALQGLKGAELQIAQELLKIDAARSEAQQSQASLSTAAAGGAGPEELRALEAAATAAGDKLKTAIISGADAIKAAAETAKQNFESAAKALQSTSESNFKFLDKATQKQVLDRARQDIATGVERGGIDRKFLNATKPEDVLAAAQASRSQVDAIEKFNTAASDYSKAITAARDAVDGVNSQLPDVVSSMSGLVGSLEGLAQKEWSVNVSVTGDSAANVRVD